MCYVSELYLTLIGDQNRGHKYSKILSSELECCRTNMHLLTPKQTPADSIILHKI